MRVLFLRILSAHLGLQRPVAIRMEILEEEGTDEVVAAVLHHLSPSASIVGIDHLSGLVDLGKANLAKDGIELGDKEGGVQVVLGDGRKGMYLLVIASNLILPLRQLPLLISAYHE